jgi:carbamoyltransferase
LALAIICPVACDRPIGRGGAKFGSRPFFIYPLLVMYILGISAYYHDSAACLLRDDEIVAAAQEERFTRVKNDERFPERSIRYCLEEAGIKLSDVQYVVFYEKPFLKFERIIETYLAIAPRGLLSYLKAVPVWIKDKVFLKKNILRALANIDNEWRSTGENLLFTEHHQSHAASAFFASPFQEAIVLTVDGVGEWTTTSLWRGTGNDLELIKEIKFPHSLGLLYAAFTYYLGFKVNSDEYKVMGLAPYGKPVYMELILSNLIDLRSDGSFRLQMEYFDYCTGATMTGRRFDKLFGEPARKDGETLSQFHMDVASSIQKVTEEVMLRIVKQVKVDYAAKYLCLAGGVALNCVANGKILGEFPFNSLWIQPAAGDAGGALGAAYYVYFHHLKNKRTVQPKDKMKGCLLGPAFDTADVEAVLKRGHINYKVYDQETYLALIAKFLDEGKVIGYFQGRSEFGPRALGARSIIADSRNKDMQSVINLKIKFRESFRPFAPAVLAEAAETYFHLSEKSPYMLLVAPVKYQHRSSLPTGIENSGFGMLKFPRSVIPAVTHVDYTSRIQTVSSKDHPAFYDLINAFYKRTGCPVIINTSFNVKDEPIVNNPQDALDCFLKTDMDILAIENIIVIKENINEHIKQSS